MSMAMATMPPCFQDLDSAASSHGHDNHLGGPSGSAANGVRLSPPTFSVTTDNTEILNDASANCKHPITTNGVIGGSPHYDEWRRDTDLEAGAVLLHTREAAHSCDVDVHVAVTPAEPAPPTLGGGGESNNAAAAVGEAADDRVDYVRRGQWLRAAVLGANDGLVSTASLMMGVGANYEKPGAMIVAGLAGLVGGACSMAIGEFVSVYTQRDAEQRHHAKKKKKKKRRKKKEAATEAAAEEESKSSKVGPNPWEAAAASAGFFAVGSAVPLMAAGFIPGHVARLLVMLAVCSFALAGMGAIAARLSGARPLPGACRVLVGGWLAMLLTFSLLRLFSVAS